MMDNHNSGDIVLVHAYVNDPWFKGLNYAHGWIEEDGLVKDWQTIENGSSKYAGKGWPIDEFYEAYTPEDIVKYDFDKMLKAVLKYEHYGPWHGRDAGRPVR